MNDAQIRKYVWSRCKSKHPEVKGFIYTLLQEVSKFGYRYQFSNRYIKQVAFIVCKHYKSLLVKVSVDVFNCSDDEYDAYIRACLKFIFKI